MAIIDSFSDSLNTKIIKQLEYYFSDINIRNDYFIRKLFENNCNKWLSIETLMKFNRLKSMVNNDKNLLIRVLKTFKSDLIELNTSGDQIRRRPDRPVPQIDEQFKRSFDEKTIQIKGLPKDTTLDELINWSQELGSVLSVKMIRLKTNKEFSGCAFVTFADKDISEKVVNQSVLQFNGAELTKEPKLKSKEKKVKNKILDQKMDTNNEMNGITDKSVIGFEAAVLLLKGLPRRLVVKEKKKKTNKVKEFFNNYGKVVYVGCDSSGNCLVQFKDQLGAQKALIALLKKNNQMFDTKELIHKFDFEGREVSAQVLTGEEEIKFWIRAKKRNEKNVKNKEKKKRRNKMKEKTDPNRKRTNSSLNPTLEPKRMASA